MNIVISAFAMLVFIVTSHYCNNNSMEVAKCTIDVQDAQYEIVDNKKQW